MGTEKRLIDANVVLAKQFTTGISDASGNYYGYADVVFVDDIENAHTVDAMEVVHGRWTDEHQGFMYYDATCSVCGKHNDSASKFCPNCGAKMDGVFDG